MPIKVKCSCGQRFSASDKMAGKRVKCPKCSQPLLIPDDTLGDDDLQLAPAAEPAAMGGGGSLMDLLDDANVKAATNAPICPSCGEDMKPDAIICLECGFNVVAGEKMMTYAEGGNAMAGMTENEKILAKAEQAIEGVPQSAEEETFGDGPESILIAIGALVIAVVLVATAVVVIYAMDQVEGGLNSGVVAIGFGVVMMITGRIWITIVGFINGVQHGAGCLFCDLYALVFAIAKRQTLWIPLGLFLLGYMALFVGLLIGTGEPVEG